MPRANRHFLSGHIWHLTHRYHRKAFLLKFARDRRRYLHRVFEATKRFGLSALDHMVTSLSRYEQKMQNRPELGKDVERLAQLV
jgi:putative transposase